MWNRRDALLMATAALATFGFTVATFWPRLATAVDAAPVAVTTVKVPTLELGGTQVTAALDPDHAFKVLLTVHNTADEATTAHFAAQANVIGPSSMMSRVGPPSKMVWSQSYDLVLQPGESKVIAAELPTEAYVAVAETKQVQPKLSDPASPAQSPFNAINPGRSFLTLSSVGGENPTRITALTLSSGAPAAAIAKSTP